MITTPFIGYHLRSFGRRAYCRLGFFVLFISMGAFATLPFIENKIIFITVSILGRLFQGFGIAGLQTALFSMVKILYPDDIE